MYKTCVSFQKCYYRSLLRSPQSFHAVMTQETNVSAALWSCKSHRALSYKALSFSLRHRELLLILIRG